MLARRPRFLVPWGLFVVGCGGSVVAPTPRAPAAPTRDAPILVDCDARPGSETDLTSDEGHCGACGLRCEAGERCSAGACRQVRKLVMVDETACAVVPRGVMCWGGNVFGKPGAPRRPWPTPRLIPGLEGAESLSIGRSGVCAILPRGAACLRDGALTHVPDEATVADLTVRDGDVLVIRATGRVDLWPGASQPAAPLVGPSGVTEMASVASALCALDTRGSVRCWPQRAADASLESRGWLSFMTETLPEQMRGDLDVMINQQIPGLLGQPKAPSAPGNRSAPKEGVAVPGLSGVVQTSGNGRELCALDEGGHITCWGWPEDAPAPVGGPVTLEGDSPSRAVSIAAGSGDSCAVSADGKVDCWGEGDPLRRRGPLARGRIEGIGNAVAVAAGYEASCVLRANGKISCWGQNPRGQLGNGSLSLVPFPVRVPSVSGVIDVALSANASCVLDGAGQIACWGAPGAYDQEEVRAFEPKILPFSAKKLGHCLDDVCGIGDAGQVTCYSVETSRSRACAPGGVVETGSAAVRDATGLVSHPEWVPAEHGRGSLRFEPDPNLTDVVALAEGGGPMGCAVRRSGRVVCFEGSAPSFLGRELAKQVTDLGVRAAEDDVIGATLRGTSQLYLLRRTGTVATVNLRERLLAMREKGLTAGGFPPLLAVDVPGLTEIIEVSAGADHACALRASGEVLCWGSAVFGQLGDGQFVAHAQPKRVEGLSNIVRVVASDDHTCAIQRGGALYCWGRNESDQLGQEPTSFAFEPQLVREPEGP